MFGDKMKKRFIAKVINKNKKLKKYFLFFMFIVGIYLSYRYLESKNIELKDKEFINLLIDNSFKFTESEGKITVEFIRVNEFMNIIVSDNGCGISESDLPRVTEKFYKGKNAKSQNGIGLSICDEITKLHKGTLKIESKENEGTRITIFIPVEVEERG